MRRKFHDDAEWASPAGAGPQEPDHVGVVDLLEEHVLGEQVVDLLPAVVGLEHLDGNPAVPCTETLPR